jgi:hypothetical protein
VKPSSPIEKLLILLTCVRHLRKENMQIEYQNVRMGRREELGLRGI